MNCMDQDAYFTFSNTPQAALRDADLISAALTGSSDAFTELQRLYSRQLYSTIFRITRNREDTEDVLQDTLLRAYLALPNFQGRSSVYSWLTRIAINSALMLLRKRRNRPEVCMDFAGEPEVDVAYLEPADPCLNPEQVYDQRQRCANIHREIGRLQVNLRMPLQTRMTHGTPLEEIAKTLDITQAAVKARLHRARTRLSATQPFKRRDEKVYAPSRSQRKMPASGIENTLA
ncbi:MAG: RNA polymerase sigma factor [Terracidiphilus sp.]